MDGQWDQSTSSQRDFLASHTPSPGSKKAREMTVISGLNACAFWPKRGRLGLFLKTLLGSSGWGSTRCYLAWRTKDTPAGRPLFQLVPSAPRTVETGSGLLPTPSGTSSHGKNHAMGRLDEWGGSSNPWRGTEIGKVRCASFEEWMMGFPTGWTELTVSETPSSRRSRKRSSGQ